jgi:(R,R)-butanediol dehydrogenase/meso-butanediol dehydrogenase/diacetyl reductase
VTDRDTLAVVRAAVLNDEHQFEVVEVPDPTPAAGELVLRVDACGICGSDLKAYHALPPGTVLGHEFCGVVVAVGTDARDRWREGQLVAAMPLRACGHCRWCLADEPAHCERVDLQGVGGAPGAFSEYVRADAAFAVALADHIGEHGALVEPLAVGLHTVLAGGLRAGDRALVIGGGNVGAAVTVWARRMGAADVVVSDPAPTRRDSAARFGATGVHDPGAGPPDAGFDVVFECVGAPGMVQAAVDAAGTRGRVVVAGVCAVPDQILPLSALLKEVEVRFAVYYRGNEFTAAADLLASGGLDVGAFVSGHAALAEIDDAFEKLQTTTTERKILVKPNG